jgi:hypothetical protein
MHTPPLSPRQNGLNLRNPAMPTDDTDPTPSSGPNSTDPMFPPKLGKAGPKDVAVTAVQGPGVDPGPPVETTTTERLLSGLLDGPADTKPKEKPKPRRKETHGEAAADYQVSPRPLPVGRKEKEEEAVIVAPVSARNAQTKDLPRVKGTRDDLTVPLPRKKDHRGLVAFLAALLLVGGIGWLLIGRTTPPTPVSAPTTTKVTLPAPPPAPTDTAQAIPAPTPTDENLVQADPVIESQQLKRNPKAPAPKPPTTATAAPTVTAAPTTTAIAAPPPSATAAPTSLPTATSASPDFDELKKGIQH